MGKCTVQDTWFNKKDSNGYFVREWASKESKDKIFCNVCKTSFSISKGFDKVRQHAQGDGHKSACRTALDPSQLHLEERRPPTGGTSDTSIPVPVPVPSTSGLNLLSVKDAGMKAALLWAMKVALSNYSFASCDGIENIFRAMFPTEGAVPSDFSIASTKATYLITEALGPYLYDGMLEDIGQSFVTLLYDETTNEESKKELAVAIRYCSSTTKLIATRHLKTFFMGSAKAEDILKNISGSQTDAGIPLTRLLMLGADGPYVNKKVHRLINEKILEVRSKPLVDMGSCPIHIVMNTFLAGLAELGDEASDAIEDVWNFFDSFPVRFEEFSIIQEKKGVPNRRFIKHVKSRWLTLEPAAQRFLEQLPATEEYFLRHLPKAHPDLSKKPGCQKITKHLKKATLKAEMLFVIGSAKIFSKITERFQADEPLVHLLYTELKTLFKTLALRVSKKSAVDDLGLSAEVFESSNLLPLKDIVLETALSSGIKSLSEKERLIFLNSARKHYITAAKEVLLKSPLTKPIVKSLRCLHPDARFATQSKRDVLQLARALPVDVRDDILADEWLLMTSEQGIEEKARVDEYWAQFYSKKHISGDPKYPSLSKVVQAALCLSHGNAFVERMFSSSRLALTEDRASMKVSTLNALNNVKDGLKTYNNKVHLVPITQSLLARGRAAYSQYSLRLAAERKEKEEEERSRLLATQEQSDEENARRKAREAEENSKLLEEEEALLNQMKKDLNEKETTVNTLFLEASERLRKATISKDIKEVCLAQAMMEGVNVAKKEKEKLAEKTQNQQRLVDKRKHKIIIFFDSKKPKRS